MRACEAAAALTDEIWVLLADPRDEPKVQEVLRKRVRFALDPKPRAGPLGALAGVLGRISSEYALLLAVDYPWMTGSLLQQLKAHLESQTEEPEVLVPIWRGIPQVTCAFYRRSLHEELESAFLSGKRSLRRFVEELPPERAFTVPEAVWREWADEGIFWNLNTPYDLERLRALETHSPDLQ